MKTHVTVTQLQIQLPGGSKLRVTKFCGEAGHKVAKRVCSDHKLQVEAAYRCVCYHCSSNTTRVSTDHTIAEQTNWASDE